MIFRWLSRLFSGGGSMQALGSGAPAPNFELKGTEGKKYSLSDALRGGPVLLAFFKKSCPTCQFTFPFLERLHQAVNGNGAVQIWGISQNNPRDTQSFAREYGCTFPMLVDARGYEVSNQYGLTHVPTLFLVQPDGKIQLSAVGFDRAALETVAAEFARLRGNPITVFQPTEAIPDYKPG